MRAWIVYKGSKEAQSELAICSESGWKTKLVDTALVDRQEYKFAEGLTLSGNGNGLQVVSFHVWPIQLSPCGTALKGALEGLFLASGLSARVAFRFRAVESFYLPDALHP